MPPLLVEYSNFAFAIDPTRDHVREAQLGFPCLQHVSFVPGDGLLTLNAFYATQQLFDKAYAYMESNKRFTQADAPKDKPRIEQLPEPIPGVLQMQNPALVLAVVKSAAASAPKRIRVPSRESQGLRDENHAEEKFRTGKC